MSKKIPVGKAEFALVDDDVYEVISRLGLKFKKHNGGYAQVSSYNLLHRMVVGYPKGMEVHHLNENKLDNRRENLELISPSDHQKYHSHRIVALQKSRKKFPDEKQCALCLKTFTVNPRKRKRNKCCSKRCAKAMRIMGRMVQCGKPQVAEQIMKSIKEIEQC